MFANQYNYSRFLQRLRGAIIRLPVFSISQGMHFLAIRAKCTCPVKLNIIRPVMLYTIVQNDEKAS